MQNVTCKIGEHLIRRPQGKRKRALLVKQFCQGKIMKRGHAHMKLLLRKNEVCTYGASVEIRMGRSTSSVVGDAAFPFLLLTFYLLFLILNSLPVRAVQR